MSGANYWDDDKKDIRNKISTSPIYLDVNWFCDKCLHEQPLKGYIKQDEHRFVNCDNCGLRHIISFSVNKRSIEK